MPDHATVSARGGPSVRSFALTDIPQIIAICEAMQSSSTFVGLPFDPDKLSAQLRAGHRDPDFHCDVVELDGLIVGVFAGCVCDYFFCHANRAYDVAFFVLPQYRDQCGLVAVKMIKRFVDFAVSRDAVEVYLGTTTSMDAELTESIFHKSGLTKIGSMWKMRM